MSYYAWPRYVPVAERRRNAEKTLAKLNKTGHRAEPVMISGRTIANSFWGKSWCENLERYSDYDNRLPRGRAYVRSGFVVDLQIGKGKVQARVCGTEVYRVEIAIAPVAARRWASICKDCIGTIDSLVELLEGRLSRSVMDRVCRANDGLFPSPGEIKLSCDCPDWADMCKHVAAVLYGIGARLDRKPELLFVLRGVNEKDLLATAGDHAPLSRKAPSATKLLDEGDIAAVFGLEIASPSLAPEPMHRKARKAPIKNIAAPGKKSRAGAARA